MLKLSDQSDPDLQRYLRNTHTHRHTDRQRFLAFIERLSVSKLILIVIKALQLLVQCHHNDKFSLTETRSKIVERTKSRRAESSVISLTSRANKH